MSAYNQISQCAIVLWSSVLIQCKPSVGTGVSNSINVLVFKRDPTLAATDNQYSTTTASKKFSYLPPHLDTLYVSSGPGNVTGTQGPTSGGALVTILGSSMSVLPISSTTYDVVLKLGSTQVPQSDVVYLNHTVLQFLTPPGQGAKLPLTLEIDRQVSNTLLFSYDPPSIQYFEVTSGAIPSSAADEEDNITSFNAALSVIRIHGQNFETSSISLTFPSLVPGFPDEKPSTTNLLSEKIIEIKVSFFLSNP